jgi:hypothetical protein
MRCDAVWPLSQIRLFLDSRGFGVDGLLFLPILYATSCFVLRSLRMRFPSRTFLLFVGHCEIDFLMRYGAFGCIIFE